MALTKSTSDGFVGMFKSQDFGAKQPRTNDVGGGAGEITFQVTEIAALQGKRGTTSQAEIDITNVDVVFGQIKKIAVQHKKSADSDWRDVGTYAVNFVGNDNSAKIVIQNMEFELEGLDHDFRAWFLNSDDKFAVQDSDGKEIGVAATTGAGFMQALSVTFNGVTDFAEYPAVTNLICINAAPSEGNDIATPATLPRNIAQLAWNDMRESGALTNHPNAAGGTIASITKAQLRNISGYIVFMYISSGNEPATEYPVETDANGGKWVRVKSDLKDNNIDIDCPEGKLVAFWVGFKIAEIVGSGTAAIDDIQYSDYAA